MLLYAETKTNLGVMEISNKENFEISLKLIEQYLEDRDIISIIEKDDELWKLGLGFQYYE